MEPPAFKDHFSRSAAQYAAFRPRYPEALFDYLSELCPERRCVWDCACGSGQASLSLAARFERVVATDASAEQLSAAEPHPRIAYRSARADSSGLEAACVDLITVAQALHWFDLDAFYREAERVLRPRGVLAAWTYGLFTVDVPEADRLLRRFYRMLDPWWPPERALVDNGYRTLAFPFDEIEPPSFEIRARWSLRQLLGYLTSWSAVVRYQEDRGEDPVAALAGELHTAWGDADGERLVTWPLAMRVGGRARPAVS